MGKALSLVIPTYREHDNITSLVEQVHSALSGIDYEILFVDDNSRDCSAELVQTLSHQYPVRMLVRTDKRGLASAVVDGIGYAGSDIVCVMDADLQHPPEMVPALFEAIRGGADIAIASRYVPGGGCEGWGLLRKVISRGAIFIAHLLLPTIRTVKDPMSGFFMLRREVVAGRYLKPTGYKILLELLIEGRYEKAVEVPFSFRLRHKGASKLNARQQVEYLKHVFSLMQRKGEFARFIKFCLVGASGVGVNMGLLWVLTEFAGLYYLVSAAISIETSIITNFLLNDYFTFHDRRLYGTSQFLWRLLKFNAVSLAGLGLNMGVLWLLTSVAGIYYLVSNLCGIAVATMWNYLVNHFWTWK
jgi:dolichol-phosphate mannosyltransferase